MSRMKDDAGARNSRPSTSHTVDKVVWKVIWGLGVPIKIKNFVWRLCNNALPVVEALWKRRVIENHVCPICSIEVETVDHMVVLCEWTRGCWFEVCHGLRIERESVSSFDRWRLGIIREVKAKGMEILSIDVAYVCWNIWKARCDKVMGNNVVDCKMISDRTKAALCEFYQLKGGLVKEKKERNGSMVKDVWKRPENGGLKVNCDGAFDHKSFEVGTGVVVRDCNGVVVDGFNRKFVADNALVAEAMALRDGIRLALKKSLQNVTFETDSRVLHNMLPKKWSDTDWKKMGSSLLQWESDPLFSAAEVVQDSADRMESIFRLLFHEQSLVQGDHSDPKLLTSIGYHRRDLATILETAKWQLEDFERAVSSLARMDQSHSRGDVISRHKQFIRAIREQINNVEKSLEEMAMGNPMKNSEWGNLTEQDRDGLASFLSGGNHSEDNHHYDLDDSDILKRFLDPATASCSTDAGIVGNGCGEIEEGNMNGVAYSSQYYDPMKENNLRKVGLDAVDSFQESSHNRNAEDGSWDLEASEGKSRSFFHENKLKGSCSRMNLFGFFNNLWTAYGSRIPSNYTKRLKDGEEGHLPSYIDASHAAQGQCIGLSSGLQGLHGFLGNVMHL